MQIYICIYNIWEFLMVCLVILALWIYLVNNESGAHPVIHLNAIVWFQKISIPHPPPPHGRSLEIPSGGGFKGSNFQGVRGVHGKLFSKGWWTTYKTLKAMYDRSEAQKHTYVRCVETKVGTPGCWDEVSIIRFDVSLFLWVLASTAISRRTAMMCLWYEVETI